MVPKRGLGDGDVVEAEVEGVGILRNPVVDVRAKAYDDRAAKVQRTRFVER
jgi:hypothetical protein